MGLAATTKGGAIQIIWKISKPGQVYHQPLNKIKEIKSLNYEIEIRKDRNIFASDILAGFADAGFLFTINTDRLYR